MKQISLTKQTLAALAVGIFLSSVGISQTVSIPAKIQKTITKNNQLPANYKIADSLLIKVKKNNIDPAAVAINYSVVSCKTPFEGRVKIEGVIKNKGANAFSAGSNQAVAILYELEAGGSPRAVATSAITNLATQQEYKLTYMRNWNKSHEFPPSYKVVIVYDPDIYMDSMMSNDDMNTGNNSFQREGIEINALKFPCK